MGLKSILERMMANRFAPRSSDRGLFDPFIPISSLKTIGTEYQTDYESQGSELTSSESIGLKRNFWPFRIIVGLVLGILISRILFLQITRGEENYSLAKGNGLRVQLVLAPRGLILDRAGQPLVSNIPSFSLVFHNANLPSYPVERQGLFVKIALGMKVSQGVVSEQINRAVKQDTGTVTLLDNLNRDQALSLELRLNNITGIEIVKTPNRQYGSLPGLGHLIGYIGQADAEELKHRADLQPTVLVGKAGLESTYDQYLQGVPGQITQEADSLGRVIRQINDQPALVGDTLLTTLDSGLQGVAARSLQDSMTKSQAKGGAAVVMDVRTGGILAMVSTPFYDNNLFSQLVDQSARQSILTDPAAPLVNRVVAGQYPSGSTIKPVIATAALSEKVITPTTKLDTSEGKITIGQWTFPDWKTHGVTEVRQAIAESNNIFFFALGGGYKNITGLGADNLAKWLDRFGFGKLTGIDIPGEAKGLVPTPSWKKKVLGEPWYIGDTYNLSIGQGDFLLTPLQLARATATIANGGTLFTPHLAKTVLRPSGEVEKDFEVSLSRQDHIADSQVLGVVREGMRQTAVSGSARSIFGNFPIEVAAKTGTAQFTSTSKDKTHSWFTAFAPYQNPEIAVTVIVEGGGEGFAVAAPVAKNIIEHHFNLLLTPILSPPPNG